MQAIVCVSENWGIGLDGELLFRISADMKRFRALTIGRAVILGSHTLKTFPGGRPLPGRRNIVLTHSSQPIEGAALAHTRRSSPRRRRTAFSPISTAIPTGAGRRRARSLRKTTCASSSSTM